LAIPTYEYLLTPSDLFVDEREKIFNPQILIVDIIGMWTKEVEVGSVEPCWSFFYPSAPSTTLFGGCLPLLYVEEIIGA